MNCPICRQDFILKKDVLGEKTYECSCPRVVKEYSSQMGIENRVKSLETKVTALEAAATVEP